MRLNIEFLINSPIEYIIENINFVFKKLLQEIKIYLNLDLIFSEIQINFIDDSSIQDKNLFIYGVKKTLKNNLLSISVPKSYKKYLRIILLKEAYNCFIPVELHDNKDINIFINQKVEIDLQNSKIIKDWLVFRRRNVISYDFMEEEYDRLDKFLKQESIEDHLSPFQFFLVYLRKNVHLIGDIKEGLYDLIFQEYTRKYTEYSDDILETIRIIADIFNKVKNYRSILDYKQIFKEFKESGIIQTKLSQRKFVENMQSIKNISNISPSYQMNWPALNVISTICFMKFNPLIENIKIHHIVKELPFFIWPRFIKQDFGLDVFGFFFIPKSYLKDLIKFLKKLDSNGFLIKNELFVINKPHYTVNLNFFRSKAPLINPDKLDYKKDYELNFFFDYGHGSLDSKLELLDWLIFDRIRYYSITGFGFERKSEALNLLKSDLLNEITSQQNLISEIKRNLNIIYNSVRLKNEILDFININQSYGFFYIKQTLNDYITIFDSIYNILLKNSSIKNYFQFQEFIRNHGISKSIEETILFNNIKTKVLRDFISLFYKSKSKFKERVEDYRNFYNLFKSFYDLRILSLDSIKTIIKDKSLISKIYQSKEEKLKNSYESYKSYNITYKLIEQRLEDFLKNNPPIIKPALIRTIGTAPFTNYFINLILKDNLKVKETIEKIKWLFPRVNVAWLTNLQTDEKNFYFQLQMPNLKMKEKYLLISLLNYLFKNNIISTRSYLWGGFTKAYSLKDFYDFDREKFFYTKDIFEQFYLFLSNILKFNPSSISESLSNDGQQLWKKKINISYLFNHIENRLSRDNFDLNIIKLNNLISFYKNLETILLDVIQFKHFKLENFFINYVNSIKLIPEFQTFGFGQYFLYFYPLDLNEIDFKHLLHSSFQKIKYPANIDNSKSFLINFIWPYRNPNSSLLNWLTKSKKVIREYCLFFIKKVLQIFHFNQNLTVNEWDLDPNRFKIYFQNILSNPDYNPMIPELKEFNIGDLNTSNYFTPESIEFKALTMLYNWKSIDIKSYLGTRNYTMVNSIINLLEKKLIFPLISVKNLDLIEKHYIILPNVKKEHNEKLQKIFSFFNLGFFYEIEGEYYIQGMPEEIKFENGVMIKLYLPDCQFDEFGKLFDLIFEYLGIKHYIILNDLVDGKNFLKSIYGSLNFLKSYNPLKNLIWNDNDKIWLNHKLFNESFEKIYPDLFSQRRIDRKSNFK